MHNMRSQLTYANVVATLALFIAVAGGSAFAVSQITSRDIKNGTIVSKDVSQKKFVAPQAKSAKKAERVDGLSVVSQRARPSQGAQRVTLAAEGGTTRNDLAVGESLTFTQAPYTFTVTCEASGIQVFVTATEAWSAPGGTHQAGESFKLLDSPPTPGTLGSTQPITITALESGSTQTITAALGTDIGGADCSFAQYSIGG